MTDVIAVAALDDTLIGALRLSVTVIVAIEALLTPIAALTG